jgi:hypothetical protein
MLAYVLELCAVRRRPHSAGSSYALAVKGGVGRDDENGSKTNVHRAKRATKMRGDILELLEEKEVGRDGRWIYALNTETSTR